MKQHVRFKGAVSRKAPVNTLALLETILCTQDCAVRKRAARTGTYVQLTLALNNPSRRDVKIANALSKLRKIARQEAALRARINDLTRPYKLQTGRRP